jgi:tetratricopeptide (TPR) repeat protein
MELTDLLSGLENDPTDSAALEDALKEAMSDEEGGALEELLSGLVDQISSVPVAETVLKTLDPLYRRNRDNPLGRVLAWHTGRLAWKRLDDPVRAELFMRTLDDSGPHAEEWREFYRGFYASRGNWIRLEQFVSESAERSGAPAVEAKRILAHTAGQYQNPSKELSYWQAVVQAVPGDEEAESQLERLFTQLERWPSLADLLKERLKNVADDDARTKVALLRGMLRIYADKMKAEPKVLATYQQILEIDPSNEDAIDALMDRYEKASRWPDYAKVLVRKIEAATDPDEQVRLMEIQANLMETRFANALEALKAYERILELAPDRRDIVEKLMDLYEKRRDFESLIRLRRAEADRIEDPVQQAAVFAELAQTATERLRKFPLAIELWQKVLEIDSGDIDALKALEALYEREKDLGRLCEILGRRIELAVSDDESVALLEKLAAIQGGKLNDAIAAMETWRRILEVRPQHDRAKRELRARYLAEHRWDDLEWFLRTYGSVDELARTLEGQIASIESIEEKCGLLFKLASIWRDEADQPTRAVKNLEAVLQTVPGDMRAATELIALYRRLSDWRRLPSVYEVAIAGTRDHGERTRLMIEAAEVNEHQLGNVETAFFWYLEAFKENMLDSDLRGQLERLAGPSGNWDIYASVLEQAAALIPDPVQQVETWLRVGEIHSVELDQAEAAQNAFQKALDLDPENRDAVVALEALYRRFERFDALIQVLQRKLEIERRHEDRNPIRFDIARILALNLGRPGDAVVVYEDVLAEEPGELRAYADLSELLLREGRFEELRGLLQRQVEVLAGLEEIDNDSLANLHCRIGTLTCGLEGVSREAVSSCAMALSYDACHADTLALLETLLAEPSLRLEVVDLLKGAFETLKRHQDLADLLEIELQVRGDSTDTVGLLWQADALYRDHVPSHERRFRTLARIMSVTPDDSRTWDPIEYVARDVDGWKELAALYDHAAQVVSDPAIRVQINLRLARIEWQELKNTDKARRAYHEVLEHDDSNEDALESLETIYEQIADHPELLKIYRRRFEVSQYTGEKIAYAFKMSAALSDHMDDVEGAISAVKMVLDLDPEYASAYRQLDTLYTRAERWYDLAKVLEERITLAPDNRERTYLRLRLAETREEKLEDLPGAVEVYRSILDGEPANEDAVRQLERLFANPEVRVLVAPILLPAYRAREDYPQLVVVHDVLAGAEDDLDRRLEHYSVIAGLLEGRIFDTGRAFEYRSRAFREAPDRAELVDELLRVARQRDSLEEGILVLVDKVFDIGDEDRRKETHRTIARVCRDTGLDRSLSKRHFAEILRMDAADQDALDSLIALHDEDGEDVQLVGLLEKKADLLSDGGMRAELLLWAGRLHAEKLDHLDDAIRVYSGVLDLDPVNMKAIESLESLYEKGEHWDELVDILGRKAAAATGSDERIAALKKKGLVQHDRQGDTTEAVETFRELMTIDPGDVDGLRTLDRFYQTLEDWWNLYATLERILDLVQGEERLTVRFRMGRLLEKELGDAVKAVDTYETLLAEYPDNQDAVGALEGMVRADEAAEEAFRILGPTLSERGEWARLFVVYEVLTDREEDQARKVANLLTMGEIAEHRMGEPIRGFECYGRAFTADPMNREALGRIEDLAIAHDMWDNVPTLLLEAARNIEGMPEALNLRIRAGRILRDRLADREGSARTYEAVVADFADNHEALAALDSLYGEMERWEDLARILRAEIDATREAEGKITFLLRLASVYEDRLDRSKAALESRIEVLYLMPGDSRAVAELRRMFDAGKHRAEVLECLEPIYQEQAAWSDLATVYESSLAAISDPDDRKTLILKLADVWLDNLGNSGVGLTWLGKAFEIDPSDESLLIRIEGLVVEASAWHALLDILLAGATASTETERKIVLWHKAAETARDRLVDSRQAEAICHWILEADSSDRQALASLDRLYEADGRWDDLLGVLRRETEVTEYDDEKIGLNLRMGALQRDRLQDLEGAVGSYRAILAMDDMHRAALESLAELHDVRDESESLFKVLGTLGDICETGTQRAELLRRMARLAETKLDRDEAALELWDEVSRLDATDVNALRELQRLLSRKGDWSAFVDACEREIPLVEEDAGRVVSLLREIAIAAESRLEDVYQAQQAWRRILAISSGDLPALQALRRLYRDSGDLEALSGVLSNLEDSGAIRGEELVEIRAEQARLLTGDLPRPEEAITWWNLVLESVPDSAEAMASLDRLFEDTGRFAECVSIVKRRANLAGDVDQRAELLVRAAEIESDSMAEPSAAAETLEEVARLQPANMDVSERLQTIYTRIEDWDRLGDVLLRRDGLLEDRPDDRVQNLMDLARVFEDRKADRDAAFLIIQKAAQVDPSDSMALAELWRLAQALEGWVDYVEALSEAVDRMPDDLRQEHLNRFGEVLWHRSGRPGQAIEWYEKVVAKWPDNETALAALTELYEGAHRLEDLVRTLDARIEQTPDYVEKVEFQAKVGRVLETGIRDPKRALEAWDKVLGFDEQNIEALESIVRLREGAEDWEEMLGALERLVSLLPGQEIELRIRMGAVLEEKVGDARRAIRAYEEALTIEPKQPVALDRLQALYGSLEDWKGLADIFERLLDLSQEVPDRILFCNRLATLWEELLGDKQKSLDYCLQILDMDPGDDEVFETAARLLSELEDWNGLIDLFESRVSHSDEATSKVATLVRVAQVYEQRLGDQNAAVSTHQRILEIDPGYLDSYRELTRLFSDMEAWEDVVESLMRWKEHVDKEHEFVGLLLRAATIVKERLENPDRAVKLLEDVLRVEPRNETACEKLCLIHGEMEEWEKVADVHLRQEANSHNDDERARYRAMAGEVFMNRLKDRPRAIQHFERALELNPRLTDVALLLAQAYVAAERWEKAEPLLDMLLGETEVTSDPVRIAEIHFQLALCAEKLLDFERAFREYTTANKLRGDHPQTVLGLARIYQRKQLWQLAKDQLAKGLELGGDRLAESDVSSILFALGEVSLELGELDGAARYLDQVLDIDRNHGKAADLQIAIAEKRGDWASVIKYRQSKAQALVDPFERFSAMLEIGDLYREKMNNTYGAVAAYKEALDLNPGAKVVLLRLFDMHLAGGAIEDALYTLERLADAEDSPDKKATHFMRMAAIYREKLNDDARAIEHLNLALDMDPERLDAFRAIDEILTGNRDWAAQAEAYRKMLERLKGRGVVELEFRLYANLGEIYRSRLKQMDYAVSAYSMAAQIKPGERRVHEILAQLYELNGDQMDRAVEEHRAILATNPLSQEVVPSYKALWRLFRETREFDKAFVTAATMVGLGIADEEERKFFEGNLEPSLPWFKGTIDPLRWESHLLAKTENTLLGRVMQILYQGIGEELGAKDLKDIGLKKKNEIDLEQKLLFVNIYKACSKALGPLPHKVYRDENPSGLKLEFLSPPALVVGADMLTGRDEREVAFLVGRQLAYLNPMHFLSAVKNLTELKVFLAAALKFCRPDTQLGAGADVVIQLVKVIDRRMPQQLKNQMIQLVEELTNRNPTLDFGKMFDEFFQGMERSALRAGTLVCGSVPTAIGTLRTEETSFSGLPQKQRLEEVVMFSMSEDHFLLRRALGIAVEVVS